MQSVETPDEFAAARRALVDEVRAEGVTDARALAALDSVPREEFVRPEDRARAYVNEALAIGGGQTISQPYVVGLMSELLQLHSGERVLEVGTGSGYQAAVLATLAGDVYSIEIDPALADTARQKLHALGYDVHVRCGDGFYGWEAAAPFDAIIITAAAPRIPELLIPQLKPGGVLVMPLGDGGHELLIRARKGMHGLTVERFVRVAFVPMRGAVRGTTP